MIRIFVPAEDTPGDPGPLIRCPECGHVDTLDGFDVLGADVGNLFCVRCHHEGVMEDMDDAEPAGEGRCDHGS